jgi:hypothetical protein
MNQELATYQRAIELAKDTIARAEADAEQAIQSRDQALRAAEAANAAAALRESQLGQAHAEITRLEEALVYVGKAINIRGARKRIAETLKEKETP